MSIEDRLRRAVHREVESVEPGHDAWGEVQHRLAQHRRHRTVRTAGFGVLAAAAAVVVGLVVASLVGDDATELSSGPGDGTTTTAAPETTTTSAPAPPASERVFPGIWPFASQEEVDAYVASPGVGMFFDAEATALEFARAYLGMPDPVAELDGDPTAYPSYTVELRPRPGSPFATVLNVVRTGTEGPFVVESAHAVNIQVDDPARGASIPNPVVVTGQSTAFEATVQVEVRQDGQAFGEALGRGFVMGGANGDLGPFAGDLTYDPPTRPAGAVVFFTDSAEDGSIQEATVVRVAFGSTEPSGAITRFSVFFHRGDELVEVGRESGRTVGVLRAALESLVGGPYAEDGEGLSSPFSSDTADVLAGVNLRDDGTAVVDLRREVPNANSSAGSRMLLEELDATVFQFSTVARVEYRLRGSCEAFWEWLQYGGCEIRERP